MSTQTTAAHNVPTVNGHMMPTRAESAHKGTTKPLLQSILQKETAAPFMKMPSSVYQIEYTSNIYNPEAINSLATSPSVATTFTPTSPTIRPMSMKTTIRTSRVPSSSTSATTTTEAEEQKHYVQPEMHAGWPVYNLIIEGHSKVKTYGLKTDNEIENNLPKIRPVQAKDNPIVERVTHSDEGPEFKVKHSQTSRKDHNKLFNKKTAADDGNRKSAMTSLLSLLDSSFGNFLSDASVGNVRQENSEKQRTRRSAPEDDETSKQVRVVSASFQVGDDSKATERHVYRKGTVISEKLWPLQSADASR